MIEKLNESSGDVLGYKLIGKIGKVDYEVLIPEVEAVLTEYGSGRLLLDMTEFKREKAEVWGADMKFGREYHKKISKMAIIGDKKWEKWMTKLASPFFADETKFYHSKDIESAWVWLHS
ncbi:MAG: STAS/SEC14 domain-containing protein [Chloroflexi bacterium]|nr:STAS/SEC14 domain-containing protein [Chloroflexota bacterium]